MHRRLAGATSSSNRLGPTDRRLSYHRRNQRWDVRVRNSIGPDVGRLQLEAQLQMVSRSIKGNVATQQRPNGAVKDAHDGESNANLVAQILWKTFISGRRFVFDRQRLFLRDRIVRWRDGHLGWVEMDFKTFRWLSKRSVTVKHFLIRFLKLFILFRRWKSGNEFSRKSNFIFILMGWLIGWLRNKWRWNWRLHKKIVDFPNIKTIAVESRSDPVFCNDCAWNKTADGKVKFSFEASSVWKFFFEHFN